MSRLVLGSFLLALACCSSKPSPKATRTLDDIDSRADEIEARLLAECSGGNESACRRVVEKRDTSQAQADPRSELVPCTAPECGMMELPDRTVIYFELDGDGEPLKPTATVEWSCFDANVVAHGTGQVLGQVGQCFQRSEVCEQERSSAAEGRGPKSRSQ
jgi:hypothetical protein